MPLHVTFVCVCGRPGCVHWITGTDSETVNMVVHRGECEAPTEELNLREFMQMLVLRESPNREIADM